MKGNIKDIKWNELSDKAKSVIEWVENPFTYEKEDIEIQVGKSFQRDTPAYSFEKAGKVDIFITMELFSEIVDFVSNDDNLEIISYDKEINKFAFKMKGKR